MLAQFAGKDEVQMRVWDVHPGYLTRSSLLGQHGEIHALCRVVVDGKKGYSRHPETLRWRGHLLKLRAVHDRTVREMLLRGFRHHTPMDIDSWTEDKGALGFVDPLPEQFELLRQKYLAADAGGRIPLPLRGSDFWTQHKYSVMARGSDACKEVRNFLAGKDDLPLGEERELVHLVHGIITNPVSSGALAETAKHIWGRLAGSAGPDEEQTFMTWSPDDPSGLFAFLYSLAEKYRRQDLLHSTIFADV